jgi:exonuclease III
MAEIITDLSILTLNVNGLNSPIKRHHLANWIKKEKPVVYKRPNLLTETNTDWQKIYQANGP